MMEAFYPEHVIGRLDVSEDDYWMGKQLEYRDWTGYRKLKNKPKDLSWSIPLSAVVIGLCALWIIFFFKQHLFLNH